MKKLISLLLALVLCAAVFAGCSGANAVLDKGASSSAQSAASGDVPAHDPGLFVDGKKVEADPMMTVEGQDVSFDLYRFHYLSAMARFSSGDTSVWDDAEKTKQLLDYVKTSVLTQYAIELIAKENNITLSDEDKAEVDTSIASLKEQMGEDGYAQALAAQYYTEDVYRTMYLNSLLMSKVLENVYGEDIKADVMQNYVHAKHILIKFPEETAASGASSTAPDHTAQKEKAEAILARVKNGEDFDALIAEYNEDSGEPAEGYYFTKGQMVQEFEDSAYALKEGETSELVETTYGYHILKRLPMEESYVSANLLSLMSEDVATSITATLQQKAESLKVTFSDAYSKVAPDTMF